MDPQKIVDKQLGHRQTFEGAKRPPKGQILANQNEPNGGKNGAMVEKTVAGKAKPRVSGSIIERQKKPIEEWCNKLQTRTNGRIVLESVCANLKKLPGPPMCITLKNVEENGTNLKAKPCVESGKFWLDMISEK